MDGAAARRARRPIAHCGQGRGCAGERPQGRPPEEVGQRLTESPVRPRGPWDAPPLSPLSDPPNNIGPACQGGAVDSGSEDKGPLSAKQIGRASCRERVCKYVKISVVADTLKKNTRKVTNT